MREKHDKLLLYNNHDDSFVIWENLCAIIVLVFFLQCVLLYYTQYI